MKKSPVFYGWIVLFFSFMGLFATLGIRNAFGAYVTLWEETFLISRTMVAAISTLSLAVYGIGQPITGKLVDLWGGRIVLAVSLALVGVSLMLSAFTTDFWQLLLLYGVFASFGFSGASNVTATALASKWFEKKRGRAMGLVLSGMAAGPLLIVPLTMYLIAIVDWRWTMLLLGLATGLVLAPLAYLFVRSNPEDIGLVAYGWKTQYDEPPSGLNTAGSLLDQPHRGITVIKSRHFWMLAFPFFVCGFTDLGLIFTHLIPYAEGRGFSVGLIAVVFSVIAAFNMLGTIASGFLSDRMHRGKQLAITYALRGLTFVLLMLADSPPMLIIFAVLFGLTEVASLAPTSSLCAHLFGRTSVGVIFGFISLSHQIGAAVGAFLSGLFYDLFGTYDYAFLLSVGLLILSAAVVYRVPDQEQKEL